MQNDIEKYLNGEMSEAERMAFEQELAVSGNLQTKVAEMRILIGALQQKKLRETIQMAEAYNNRRKTARFAFFLLFCVCTVGLVWWFYTKNQNVPPLHTPDSEGQQRIAPPAEKPAVQPGAPALEEKQHLSSKSQPIAQTPSRPGDAQPNYRSLPAPEKLPADAVALADQYLPVFVPHPYINMAGLNQLWEAGDFEAYLNMLRDLDEKNGVTVPNPEVQLVRAACLLRLHRPSQATQLLDILLEAKDPVRSDAVWLLALCYVMQGKDDSARSALAGIKGKFVKPAKELLGKMGGE